MKLVNAAAWPVYPEWTGTVLDAYLHPCAEPSCKAVVSVKGQVCSYDCGLKVVYSNAYLSGTPDE